MQTYLKNGYIVSMDQQDTVFDGGGVLVEDDRITAVGKVDPRLVKPDAAPAPQRILDKHYLRKHGPNAYYGQKK